MPRIYSLFNSNWHIVGAAFVELYFVMSSLFASRAYYAFGFLALTAGVVTLTTGTVTILFTYFNLCAEEYRCVGLYWFVACLDSCRWHWRAFLTGGGSAFWLLAYGLFYWMSRLSLDSLSSVTLYLGYLFLICLFDFLVTGKQSWSQDHDNKTHHSIIKGPLDSLHLTGLCGACIVRSAWTDVYAIRHMDNTRRFTKLYINMILLNKWFPSLRIVWLWYQY